MRVILVAVLILSASLAAAGEVTLQWNESTGATSYPISMSVDNGATWAEIAEVAPAANCTGGRCALIYTAPDNQFVLFRYGARNAVGDAVRYREGAWHHSGWGPPPPPAQVGVQ
jgi:hypothetical protein